MTKEEFLLVIEENIIPLFTGSFIAGETESSTRDFEVAQGYGGTVLLKAHKADEYRIILKRNQPFKNDDVQLLKSIVSELIAISELNISDKNYIKKLQNTAIEKAICESLSLTASTTLLGIIAEITKWANRTYEGKKLELGIIINELNQSQNKIPELHYTKILGMDFFALLSDGRQSYIEVDRDGYLLGHVQMDKQRSVPTLCPNDFINIARFCGEKRICFSLLETGDILVFKNRELVYAKRRGNWNNYCHEEIIGLLSNRTSHTIKDIRRAIYFTALDCSFTNSGGCLVYINKDRAKDALLHINSKDILTSYHYEIKKEIDLEEAGKLYNLSHKNEIETYYNKSYEEFLHDEKCSKSLCLKKIIGDKKFHELSRKLREELVGMDGATIIDYDGTIIAAGAIIKIEAGSESGGRLAATMTLAKYGVAIKISTDGILQGFSSDKRSGKVKSIFIVG